MLGTRFALGITIALAATGARAEDTENRGPRVMSVVDGIQNNLVEGRYSHVTRVNEKAGSYEFDCSGMVAWVLRRSAPKAGSAVAWTAGGRPLARDYYRRIARTKADKPRWGWARVARVADTLPGDVIAWLRPKEIRSVNTGHVAFVVAPPKAVAGHPNAYLLRIADASRYQHDHDTRRGTERDGFGIGTILVLAHPETGAPYAYGWFGLRSGWILTTKMAIGRPVA